MHNAHSATCTAVVSAFPFFRFLCFCCIFAKDAKEIFTAAITEAEKQAELLLREDSKAADQASSTKTTATVKLVAQATATSSANANATGNKPRPLSSLQRKRQKQLQKHLRSLQKGQVK